ncbi:hypothetical protein [Streptomyces sp. NPDC051286]|uniref:hypothetical protein n=1 Tax=Streptomyces sp. NPDC051286 TaxID=3365647 RepID=UPI0037BCA5EE
MNTTARSRRSFLAGAAAGGATALMSGCAASSTTHGKGASGGAVTLQSNLSLPQANSAAQEVVDAFNKRGGAKGSLNAVASETFRTHLPMYLTSATPPGLCTSCPRSVAESHAMKDLLFDVSDSAARCTDQHTKTVHSGVHLLHGGPLFAWTAQDEAEPVVLVRQEPSARRNRQ